MKKDQTPAREAPSEMSGMKRRSFAKGALWATPAVIVAGPAPVLAASPADCPTLAPASAWVGPIGPEPEFGVTEVRGDTFFNNGENETTAYRRSFTTTLEVQEGWSYDLSTMWRYRYASDDRSRSVVARFDLRVDGDLVIQRYTRANGGTAPPPPLTFTPATGTYTATTTGTVTVEILFVVAAATGERVGGDDITLTTPEITNCDDGAPS